MCVCVGGGGGRGNAEEKILFHFEETQNSFQVTGPDFGD